MEWCGWRKHTRRRAPPGGSSRSRVPVGCPAEDALGSQRASRLVPVIREEDIEVALQVRFGRTDRADHRDPSTKEPWTPNLGAVRVRPCPFAESSDCRVFSDTPQGRITRSRDLEAARETCDRSASGCQKGESERPRVTATARDCET